MVIDEIVGKIHSIEHQIGTLFMAIDGINCRLEDLKSMRQFTKEQEELYEIEQETMDDEDEE